MTRLERYLTAWPRYHRSRGFGIHSPFAFRFVLRVLRERCPYYAYASLDAKRGEVLAVPKRVRGKASHVASRNEMRMLFRIANCFNPQRMLLLGEHCGLSAFALLSVSSKSEMRLWKSDYDGSLAAATLSGFGNRIEVDSSVEKAFDAYLGDCGGSMPFVVVSHVPSDEAAVSERLLALASGERDAVVVVRNLSTDDAVRRIWKSMLGASQSGMSFSNGKTGVFVASSKLPLQHFSLWF